MQNIKVLIVCKFPPPYLGTTVWAETLSKSELNSQFNIQYFNNNTHKNIQTIGKLSLWSTFSNFLLYFKLPLKLLSFRPDLVLIPFSQSAFGFLKDSIFMLICFISARRPLLMLHGSNFRNWHSKQNIILKWYTKKIICSSKGVIVLGNNLTYLFSDWVGNENVFAVPNGLNVIIPEKQKKVDDKVNITYLGNLQSSKGIEDVVSAFTYIRDLENITLDVIGSWRDSDTKKNCLSLKEKYNLPINFLDALYGEDKLQVLANTDIFIFPPRMPEGHPLVIVEAMAAGLPIISTNQGAIAESVIDGVNGFIVDICSPQQIASKIQYLIDNPGIRIKMGKESRRIYEVNFTEQKMVENLSRVFQEVINRN